MELVNGITATNFFFSILMTMFGLYAVKKLIVDYENPRHCSEYEF